MQQAEWPKDAWLADCLTGWLPDCLAAWLYSISIGACFKSIFIIIFISFFFSSRIFPSFFYFFYFCSLGSFAFTVRSFGIIIAPCGQFVGCFCGSLYVGDAAASAKSGTQLKAAIKVVMFSLSLSFCVYV